MLEDENLLISEIGTPIISIKKIEIMVIGIKGIGKHILINSLFTDE